ncbi:MAG TPA: hypothetical protein VN932_01710 [Rhizomicrobium sp.]|nr:hypothetical protein [Rhizomicrobium sp.]
MASRIPRLLLAIAALLMLFAAVMHALAYRKADAAVAVSNLAAFFGASLRTFWLNDSAVTAIVAAICILLVVRPQAASRAVILLLALIPATIGVLLYIFLGNFFAAPFMLVVAALVFAAGLSWPKTAAQIS